MQLRMSGVPLREPAGPDFRTDFRLKFIEATDNGDAEMIFDMTAPVDSGRARGQRRSEASAAGLLSFAAAPTFAAMALLTAVHGGSMPARLCSATQDASPLTGMVSMYLLMSAFHLAPWLRLLSRRRL